MTKEQIKTLREMMDDFHAMRLEEKQEYATQILAYLQGCLDGIKT